MTDSTAGPAPPLTFRIGQRELVIRKRYEVLSIINDVLIGVWFLVGSILFFNEATTRAGTWLFVIGSAELLVRPLIRLSRLVHLRYLPAKSGLPGESSHDF